MTHGAGLRGAGLSVFEMLFGGEARRYFRPDGDFAIDDYYTPNGFVVFGLTFRAHPLEFARDLLRRATLLPSKAYVVCGQHGKKLLQTAYV